MPGGLDSEAVARLTRRHGSVNAAYEKARQDPRFAAPFREVIGMQFLSAAADDLERSRSYTAELWQLVAAWDMLDEEPVNGTGAFLPWGLIREALRTHVDEGVGRRKLARIPGLTEWTARELLSWFKVGEPDGLWLDAAGRAQAGARLAPTRDGVRLPRI